MVLEKSRVFGETWVIAITFCTSLSRPPRNSLDPKAIDMLYAMMELNPARRCSALEALNADYLWSHPLPASPDELPKFESSHEYDGRMAKERRDAMRRDQGLSVAAPLRPVVPVAAAPLLSYPAQQQQPSYPSYSAPSPPSLPPSHTANTTTTTTANTSLPPSRRPSSSSSISRPRNPLPYDDYYDPPPSQPDYRDARGGGGAARGPPTVYDSPRPAAVHVADFYDAPYEPPTRKRPNNSSYYYDDHEEEQEPGRSKRYRDQ